MHVKPCGSAAYDHLCLDLPWSIGRCHLFGQIKVAQQSHGWALYIFVHLCTITRRKKQSQHVSWWALWNECLKKLVNEVTILHGWYNSSQESISWWPYGISSPLKAWPVILNSPCTLADLLPVRGEAAATERWLGEWLGHSGVTLWVLWDVTTLELCITLQYSSVTNPPVYAEFRGFVVKSM